MIFLIIIGGIMIAGGLFGLGYCIRQGFRIRSADLPPEEIHTRLHGLIAVNLGSVALSALGLGLMLAGLLL